jgi:hypothetical protein
MRLHTHAELVTLIADSLSRRGIDCPPELAESLADCEGVIHIEDDAIRDAIAGARVQELIDEITEMLEEAEEVGF